MSALVVSYDDEPKTVEEMLERYRQARRRLNSATATPERAEPKAAEAERILAFAIALAGVAGARARAAEERAAALRAACPRIDRSPLERARAELTAVSVRTGVPIEEILGRRRVLPVATARHEAIWRVRRATKWSLPRIGRFFGDRDHTTVLNSIRRMEARAANDPSLGPNTPSRTSQSRTQ